MSTKITLKSFPFDSMEVLNEESGQMEDDRLYKAEVFRKYFAKFLSNGVYFGYYKNLGENGMKVTLDSGLTIKVGKGCGIINGADYELENDTLIALERPASGERKDRVVVRVDDTLAIRESQLYVKEGNGTTPAVLQRDENIYEICVAEVTVKSTSNLTTADIKDTRLDKELCGIVNSLISVDGQALYEQFQEYIDTVAEALVRKDQTAEFEEKIIAKKGVQGNVTGNCSGSSSSCTGNSATATKLQNARNIKLQGAVSGNANFDGSTNITINTEQANIAVLTGNITISNGEGTTNVAYPARIQ